MLEICPSSDLLTGLSADEDALRERVRAFADQGVAFTIATDGQEMMQPPLRDELTLLLRSCALKLDEAERRERRGHPAAIRTPKGVASRSIRRAIAEPSASLPRSPTCSVPMTACASASATPVVRLIAASCWDVGVAEQL